MTLTSAQERFLENYLEEFVDQNVISAKARALWAKYSPNKGFDGKWHTATDPRIRKLIDVIEDRAIRAMTDDENDRFNRLGRGLRGNRCWKGYAPVRGKKPYSKGSCRKIRRNPKPPQSVRRVACGALKDRKKHRRGGTGVGVARARDLCRGANVSHTTLKRMRSYFARHRASKNENAKRLSDRTSAASIADRLWGGTAGMRWAERFQ